MWFYTRMSWPFPIFVFIWMITLINRASAGNYTVDDAASGITYSAGGWNVGNECPGCYAQPDKTKAHGATWHDATRGSGGAAIYFEYSFQGTDVYIYGIIADIVTTTYVFTTNNDMTLSIDNNLVATFKHTPRNLNAYSYNQPVFAIHGLSASSHVVRLDVQPSSLFIFDYLIFTTPDITPSPNSPSSTSTSTESSSTPSSSSSSSTTTSRSSSTRSVSLSTIDLLSFTNEPDVVASVASSHQNESDSETTTNSKKISTGALVGIILGGIGLVLLLGFLFYLLCTQRRRQQRRQQGVAFYQSPIRQTFPAGGPEGPMTGHNGSSVSFPQAFNDISMTSIPHPYSAGVMPLNENNTSPLNPNDAMVQAALWTMPSPNDVDPSNLNSKQRMMQQHHQAFIPANWQAPPPHGTDPMPMWVMSASMNRMSSLVSGDNTSSSGVTRYSRAYGGERVSEVESAYPYNIGILLQQEQQEQEQRSDGRSLTSGYPESVTSDERLSPRVALRSIRIGTAEAKNINIDRGVIVPRSSTEKDSSIFTDTRHYHAAINARDGGGGGGGLQRMRYDTEAEEELSSVLGRGIAASASDDHYEHDGGDDGHVMSRPPTAPPPYIRSPPPPPHESIPAVPALPSNLRSNRI
ncbi:hypothetical protein FRC16_004799 [Serendipita sp. 398]|nr:hypothetical protein FRC16_004799 [Serendipita sp. 398]